MWVLAHFRTRSLIALCGAGLLAPAGCAPPEVCSVKLPEERMVAASACCLSRPVRRG